MSRLTLVSIGTNKVKVIKTVRDTLGLDLKDATALVNSVANGEPYVFENLSDAQIQKLREGFIQFGAVIHYEEDTEEEDEEFSSEEETFEAANQGKATYAAEKVSISQTTEAPESGKYVPPVDADDVHLLDRKGTLVILKECKKIAKGYEKVQADIISTKKEVDEGNKKVEELRNAISPSVKRMRQIVTLIAFCVGLAGTLLCIVTGIAAYAIMSATLVKADRKKHQDENNAKADAYLNEHVNPLIEQLQSLYAERDDYEKNGRCSWALSIVGKDLFYSACIEDLYNLVESHRADNLKEALNQYDDALYKARMEEMQASIQNAAEISAAESVKQTAYNKEIAKSSRQAANASIATAINTHAIDKNTRNSKKK